jgi:hypothetical protein
MFVVQVFEGKTALIHAFAKNSNSFQEDESFEVLFRSISRRPELSSIKIRDWTVSCASHRTTPLTDKLNSIIVDRTEPVKSTMTFLQATTIQFQIQRAPIVAVVEEDSIFVRMMAAAEKVKRFPPPRQVVHQKDVLYNDILALLAREGFKGWETYEVGERFLHLITNALWMFDPVEPRLKKLTGLVVPHFFSRARLRQEPIARAYNDPAGYKQKTKLDIGTLVDLQEKLDRLLLESWFRAPPNKMIREAVATLRDISDLASEALRRENEAVKAAHASLVPLRTPGNNGELFHVAARDRVSSVYSGLDKIMHATDLFTPVSVHDLTCYPSPGRRSVFLQNLHLSCSCTGYRFDTGNDGILLFLWRDERVSDADTFPQEFDSMNSESINLRIVESLKSQITVFHTRSMKKSFFKRYSSISNTSPAVLRSIYSFLTGDASQSECSTSVEVDERIELLLSCTDTDDIELVYDLRLLNGSPGKSIFNEFWEKLRIYLESVQVPDDRRHGSIGHFPIILSVPSLRKRMREKYPELLIPSETYLRYY